ncbi:hypothetical protein OIDMADRAFT_24376 [Oidiodendron maius Zn]|uniref:MRH domain-containing protein n=1 Tax=Oidiodendron maius (strain Zn) TaxID=913774 RepID=A0A0C3D426_OIDMZ|nr:hypothetical protein OIDMADRAFT_24376 [Oidiodendron maius Zn]
MHLSSLPNAALLLIFALTVVSADDKTKPHADPCTIASSSGAFFDLGSLAVLPVEEGKKPTKTQKTESWHAKGYDYPANFTLNVCAPVIEKLDKVQGVDEDLWKDVGAYYAVGSKQFSLGQQSSNLTIRGRRLILQYINGSPCGESSNSKRAALWSDDDEEDEDDDYDDEKKHKDTKSIRRKSATISFHCDKDPLATGAVASYVSVDPDECAYFFEVLSPAACGGAAPAKEGLGPASVFAIIGAIAILVYFLGGVVYQRNVAHARGWRQLPNFTMWAGIWGFITIHSSDWGTRLSQKRTIVSWRFIAA